MLPASRNSACPSLPISAGRCQTARLFKHCGGGRRQAGAGRRAKPTPQPDAAAPPALCPNVLLSARMTGASNSLCFLLYLLLYAVRLSEMGVHGGNRPPPQIFAGIETKLVHHGLVPSPSFRFLDLPTVLLLLYGSYCIDAMIRPSILYLRLKINVWARLFYLDI